jgi:predicted kinase
MEMIVFSGIQGAGKSTFFHQRFASSHVRLSLDVVRTRNREDILLFACLAAQQPCVIDNTNPTANQRARYAAIGKAAGFRTVLYFFDVDLEQGLARNAGRSEAERIPEIGVRGTFAKLERPTMAENFDQIFLVKLSPENVWATEELRSEI